MLLLNNDLSYEEVVEYLLGVPKFARKNTVEDTGRFLKVLGSPGAEKKIIHVAGTNGKGSVCAYLSSILKEAGYSAGMFTSPHLTDMRERFRINGCLIEKEQFIQAFKTVMGGLDAMRAACHKGGYHPTFFELLFLMGMVVFQKNGVDFIILETGLGGRLDATNAVERPILTVITEIGMDHMEYLGNSIGEIAGEKAGILKRGVPVVFCDKRKEATEVILKQAQSLGIKAFPVGAGDFRNMKLTNKNIDFSLHSRYYNYISLTLKTKALYQVENASIAARCMEELSDERITDVQIAAGIKNTAWEGRMEEVLPGVFVDGAHNEDGIRALTETVKADECKGSRFLLFSTVSDKDYESMIRIVVESPLFKTVAAAGLANSRAVSPDILQGIFESYEGGNYFKFGHVEEALRFLLEKKKEQDYIYIAGSLYLAGEVKALLRRRTDD